MKHVPINRNVAVVGPTGSGKTVGWVIPSILAAEGCVVVTDTKGTLHSLLRDRLAQQGYAVKVIDFVNPTASSVGYDPLDQIRVTDGKPNEQDMATVAHALCPIENLMDPFWDYAACNLIQSMIGYVMEALPDEEHNLSSVAALYQCIADGSYAKLIDELETMSPDSYAVRQYASTRAAKDANAYVCVKKDHSSTLLPKVRDPSMSRSISSSDLLSFHCPASDSTASRWRFASGDSGREMENENLSPNDVM